MNTITWVALLRGINLGSHNKLSMKALVACLESLGLETVRTYLQSGNAVFRSGSSEPDGMGERIRRGIHDRFGIEPAVLVLEMQRLQSVVDANPFPEAAAEPKTLHAYFLSRSPVDPDLEGLERLRRDSERFRLGDRVLYLHAPQGIARSRLAAGAEKPLGVPATGRNWRSVTSILALAREVDAGG